LEGISLGDMAHLRRDGITVAWELLVRVGGNIRFNTLGRGVFWG
jgi:hypothetical protein